MLVSAFSHTLSSLINNCFVQSFLKYLVLGIDLVYFVSPVKKSQVCLITLPACWHYVVGSWNVNWQFSASQKMLSSNLVYDGHLWFTPLTWQNQEFFQNNGWLWLSRLQWWYNLRCQFISLILWSNSYWAGFLFSSFSMCKNLTEMFRRFVLMLSKNLKEELKLVIISGIFGRKVFFKQLSSLRIIR